MKGNVTGEESLKQGCVIFSAEKENLDSRAQKLGFSSLALLTNTTRENTPVIRLTPVFSRQFWTVHLRSHLVTFHVKVQRTV